MSRVNDTRVGRKSNHSTYDAGEPDKNQCSSEKRVVPGSQQRCTLTPMIEKIYDEKKDKEYLGLFLEESIPQEDNDTARRLGGRVQMAYDGR